MREIRKNYADIFARCQDTVGCFIHTAGPRSVFEVTEAEREAFWEKRYASRASASGWAIFATC